MQARKLADPKHYFGQVGPGCEVVAEAPPVCLHLETTNRCNLLCETCPRTFEELESPVDMSWELLTRIVDQVPNVARIVPHGVGEPMPVRELPHMIRYLKARGVYVLLNTNGTLLKPKKLTEAPSVRRGRLRDGARGESSLFEQTRQEEQEAVDAAQALGVTLDARGATEPGLSRKQQTEDKPWSTCRCPWSLMYFTAHGRAMPCCIAPFSARGYASYTLGDATQQTLREIWSDDAYQHFRAQLLGDARPKPCQNGGLRWSL